jgi:hypothetical protein
MATVTSTVGTGGDYASLNSWAAARGPLSVSGDIEEAVLLDATETTTPNITSGLFANNVTVRIKGNTPHLGDPAAGVTKTGGTWNIAQNDAAKVMHVELVDLVIDGTGLANYTSRINYTSNVANTAGSLTCRNVIVKNITGWPNYGILMNFTNAGLSSSFTALFENCIFWNCLDGASSDGYAIRTASVGTGDRNLTFRGCTFYDAAFHVKRDGSHTVAITMEGCLLKPDNTHGEYTTSDSTSTVTGSSSYCITSRSSGDHATLFGTAANNSYSRSFVTGTPASGEVGFTDISTGDFSLVEDANNLAIDYVQSGTMPDTDIAGATRPLGVYDDAGAFEAAALVSPPDAPTGFTAGAITHNSLAFSWTDVATDETGYKVEYKEASSGTWLEGNYALPADTTSYTQTGLVPETLYDVRIAAFNDDGDSSWLTDQMTTDAAPTPPPVTARPNRGGLSLGLGLGMSGRRSGGSASASSTLLWSSASSWDSGVPGPGDDVTIPAGTTIVLDTTTAALGTLTVEGTLQALQGATLGIEAQLVYVEDGGTLRIGSEAEPFTGTCTITLTGATPTGGEYITDGEDGSKLYNGMKRALMCADGGTVEIHGTPPTVTRTRIGAHIDVSSEANEITLSEPVTWKLNDKIVLSKTDFYGVGDTELLTVAANVTNSTTVPVVESIANDRWGVLQYPTDSGMSLTAGTFTPTHVDTPTVLDERATVIHLTRNIVIQGKDDTSWSTDKFGGHTMVEPPAEVIAPADPVPSSAAWRVEGVEFRRMGQQHFKGRYPIHFHMLSFGQYGNSDSGVEYGDVPAGAIYVRDCSVWDSSQRAVVIHGTCGVEVDSVVAYDIEAHAFFEEEGSEERNTINNCAVMKVRDPGVGKRVKEHDSQPAGFWLTNPNNTITNNYASDCTHGFWNSFAYTAFGLSRDVAVVPKDTVILEFADNVAHSCLQHGMRTEFLVTNEAGGLIEAHYTAGGNEFTLSGSQIWKCDFAGYKNRVQKAQYVGWTVADNDGFDFFGVALIGAKIKHPLCVAQSLNSTKNPSPPIATTAHAETFRHAFASYHFELDFEYPTLIGYNLTDWTAQIYPGAYMMYHGGALNTGDLYTDGIFWEMGRSPGWHLINSHAGRLPTSPYFDGFTLNASAGKYRYWSLAGGLHDPYGYWGTAGYWILPNEPLYTTDLSTYTVIDTYWVETPDLIYGIAPSMNGSSTRAMTWRRLASDNSVVDTHVVGSSADAQFFGNMRAFVANRGSRFKVEFPDDAVASITEVKIGVELGYTTEEWFIICVPWDGSVTPSSIVVLNSNQSTTLRTISTSVGSVADVESDTTGQSYYQDTANDLLWLQYRGTSAGSIDPAGPFEAAWNACGLTNYCRFLKVTA